QAWVWVPTAQFGQDSLPPHQTDWPNARGAKGVIDLVSWVQNLLENTLTPAVVLPFSQLDWPNPLPSRLPKDWIWQSSPLGQDVVPPRQLDWPNVTIVPARSITLSTWLQDLLQSTLAPIVIPFTPIDWQNPIQPRRPQDWIWNPQLQFGRDV